MTATLILICLSSAPYMSITRWVTDVGLSHTAWPYVYTYWGPAVVGSLYFARDVVSQRHAIARSRPAVAIIIAAAAVATLLLASALWTDSPTTSPTESTLAVLVIATAVWFGLALPWRTQVQALFVAMHVLTVGSLIAVIVAPSARSAPFLGDKSWLGLFGNPNSLGPVATFGVLTAFAMATIAARHTWPFLALLAAIDLIVAAGATSVTAWLAGGAAVGSMLLVAGLGGVGARRRTGVRLLAAGVTIGGAAMVAWTPEITHLVGKDPTLTGRTVVWGFVFDSLESRWLLGFGFGSFWDDPARRTEYMTSSGRDWVLSSHSTFVDTLLYTGAVGLTLLAVLTVAGAIAVGRRVRRTPDMPGAFWAGVLVFAMVENLAESMMLMHSVFWLLLLAPGLATTHGADHCGSARRSTAVRVHTAAAHSTAEAARSREARWS